MAEEEHNEPQAGGEGGEGEEPEQPQVCLIF